MTSTQHTKRNKIIASIALLALTGAITATALTFPTQSTQVSATQPAYHSTTTSVAKATPSASQSSVNYKDGTYSAVGQYISPGGKEKVNVSLTVSSDVVADATVTSGANDPTAVSYQTLFISGYKPKVIGKKLSSIKLTNVSGSSLTSQGFNSAVNAIKQQAKA
jgi:uncharacterized protein with FMN-binding domain